MICQSFVVRCRWLDCFSWLPYQPATSANTDKRQRAIAKHNFSLHRSRAMTHTPVDRMNLFDLTGEVAVVIGATGVLGGAIAEGLARAGARVAVVAATRIAAKAG